MTVEISPSTHPVLSGIERPFFDHWLEHVVDPADPHLQRWTDYEEGAVDRAGARTAVVEQYTPVAGRRVLEIGCQNGAWLIALARAGADAVGIDVVEPAVRAASVRADCWQVDIDARVGDACALDLEDESFDVVASSDVIEHVPSKEAMVRDVMRVLRPGGVAVISAPQRFSVKHLRSDPHYQYAGVSVLPAPVISWYLTTFRGESVYEVETLPTRTGVNRMFRRAGGRLVVDEDHVGSRGAVGRASSGIRRLVDELRQGFTVVVTKDDVARPSMAAAMGRTA